MTDIATQLNISRQTLLDLSTRNRLISIPRKSKTAKIVQIVDELSTETYRLLVSESRAMSFLPGREKKKPEDGSLLVEEEDDDFGELPQPEDDEVDENGMAKRHTDHRLQTLLTSEGLQKRLLSLYYDARTFEEEQGVNILYLALGMLKWFEDDKSDIERYAPLILVPVSLERGNAKERFKLKWREEECAANLSLQAKMKADFGIIIPDLPEKDDIDIGAYIEEVRAAVSSHQRFEVKENEIVLGFFSFAKFLMYRDLDSANWPENAKLDDHPLIGGLVKHGFASVEGMIGEDDNVDEHIMPEQMMHVVDADGSQTIAIEEVRRGRNLVIQGPPGTGKSQTITNIIASAVAEGKKVLFVAEKMAALEVVHRRMSNIGLGPLCLELHSHKSNKRSVLEELKSTKDLGRPRGHDGDQATAKVKKHRDLLNKHAAIMHTKLSPANLTTYQIIGQSVRLRKNEIDVRGIVLDKPETWSPEDRQERVEILADVVSRIREIGMPCHHVWRGVSRSPLLPNEYDRLCDDLKALKQSYSDVMQDVHVVEKTFNGSSALASLNLAKTAANTITALSQADYTALSDPLWLNDVALLQEIVDSGAQYEQLKSKLKGVVSDIAWDTNLVDSRQQIAIHGESLLRILKSSYRQSMALFKSLLTVPMPKTYAERLQILDDLIKAQKLENFIKEKQQSASGAFGSIWQSTNSDWALLQTLMDWRKGLSLEELPKDFLKNCSQITALEEWKELATRLHNNVPQFFTHLSSVFGELKLSNQQAFSCDVLEDIEREEFSARVDQWLDNMEMLSKWILFKGRYDELCEKGLQAIAHKLWDGQLALDKVQEIFERVYFDVLTEIAFTQYPELRNFDGDAHDILVNNFRENDYHRIEQMRIEIRARHYNNMPKGDGGIGALGVLNGEFAKKRNHLPIRQLIRKAGPVIQALKPVFMMSPLSVAQFLEPGGIEFDLLVMDEASQVEPVDAFGAIARAKQVVVVGDTRQLPPTRFFARMTGNIDSDEDDDDNVTVAAHDVESILNLCLAKGLPQRMLRWHYRSKHQSLIAVSNKEFYENRLFIVPSPYDAASGMGLKFNYLPEGVFDSGGTATNAAEAKIVAQAVIKHAKETPELSLGVAAFSVKQRQAILDEVELLRRQYPETESFFTQANRDEPFFVKNLENIQGDERDVIYISIGYARNSSGYLAMRFGPLSAEGGERRLNVLISRAKRRCEIFSSITADDIDLERARGAGVAALKLFLKFAETGMLDFGRVTDREADSVFEEQVAASLRSRGYDVKNQIGIAGFFVDLAIVDPDQPGRYVLGIECDGASYHSSRSARDRDRLRQAVLEDHGWIIHRIWSTDWFRRPTEQLDKTINALEKAKQTLAAREEKLVQQNPHQVFEIISHEDDEVITVGANVGQKSLSVPYKEASFPVPNAMEPHEILDTTMAEIIAKIVAVEGPIHEEEVITRVRNLWGLARAGNRIKDKVKRSLAVATKRNNLVKEEDCYLEQGQLFTVRDRSDVSSASLKKLEYLPPQEIRKAILALLEANYGASHEQLPTEVARLLGFKSTSAQLREVIEKQVTKLIKAGDLQENGDHLTINDQAMRA